MSGFRHVFTPWTAITSNAFRIAAATMREWVELRKLALDARRLFEAQERQVLGAAAPRGEGASRSPAGEGHSPIPHTRHVSAGQAIYEAPALPAGHRRA